MEAFEVMYKNYLYSGGKKNYNEFINFLNMIDFTKIEINEEKKPLKFKIEQAASKFFNDSYIKNLKEGIEIKTLEDLTDFIDFVGYDVLISLKNKENMITIYNGYLD